MAAYCKARKTGCPKCTDALFPTPRLHIFNIFFGRQPAYLKRPSPWWDLCPDCERFCIAGELNELFVAPSNSQRTLYRPLHDFSQWSVYPFPCSLRKRADEGSRLSFEPLLGISWSKIFVWLFKVRQTFLVRVSCEAERGIGRWSWKDSNHVIPEGGDLLRHWPRKN